MVVGMKVIFVLMCKVCVWEVVEEMCVLRMRFLVWMCLVMKMLYDVRRGRGGGGGYLEFCERWQVSSLCMSWWLCCMCVGEVCLCIER